MASRIFFESGEVEVLPFAVEAADRYSVIRSTTRTTHADAIHLATAATAGVNVFVTNDADLRTLRIPGIQLMADLEGKIF